MLSGKAYGACQRGRIASHLELQVTALEQRLLHVRPSLRVRSFHERGVRFHVDVMEEEVAAFARSVDFVAWYGGVREMIRGWRFMRIV